MKNIFILGIFGVITFMPLCYANTNNNINAAVNADPNNVTTSMSGNTSTNSGIPISSTSDSAEGGNASGSAH